MKQLIFRICFLLLVSSQAIGQQTHFIYLQTENREPFYALLNKKTISSSAIGYMIIPKLENGEYNIRIGFAKNAGTEQDYVLQVKDNEQGYLIKEFGGKGWALFNLQSLNLQYAGEITKKRGNLAAIQQAEAKQKAADLEVETKKKGEEAAATELALKTELEMKAVEKLKAEATITAEKNKLAEQKSADSFQVEKNALSEKTEAALKTKSSSVIKPNIVVVPAEADAPINIIKKDDITSPQLITQQRTDSGYIYKYAVKNVESSDTVNVFIKGAPPIVINPIVIAKPKADTALQSNTTKDSVKFLNMDFKQDSSKQNSDLIEPVFKNANPPEVRDYAENNKVSDSTKNRKIVINVPAWNSNVRMDSLAVKNGGAVILANTNCRTEADDKDFYSLRKKMASEDGADEMVMVAKKLMKEKCFSTTQVRNLSVLFLNDADRYQFLDAAYPFTHDAYQYDKLMNLLYDNYYIQRFKAMIRK